MIDKTVVETLQGARSRVLQGWRQDGSIGVDGKVCAIRAIQIHLGTLMLPDHIKYMTECYARSALMSHLPEPFVAISQYNDDKNTVKDDIVNLFDKALAELGGLA